MIGFCSSQGVYNQAGEIVSNCSPNEAQARVEELEADEDYNSGTVRFLRGAVEGLPQRRTALPPDQLSGKWRCCRSCFHATASAPSRHGERGADPSGDHQ